MVPSFSLLSGITESAIAPTALTVVLTVVTTAVTAASATAKTAHPVTWMMNRDTMTNLYVEHIDGMFKLMIKNYIQQFPQVVVQFFDDHSPTSLL